MFAIDPVSVLLSITVLLLLLNTFYQRKGNNYKNFPPGPKPWPVIGNLHILDKRKPFKTFQMLAEEYGSVFSFHMGMKKVVVLCGSDTVKDALVNHADVFSGRPVVPIFHDALKGYGIVFADGENWKVMRRFSLTTLRDFGMGKKVIESLINEECDSLVEVFKSYKGKPFENTLIINGSVSNVIVSVLLGHRFDYNDPTFVKLRGLINSNFKVLGSPMVLLYNIFPSLVRLLPGSHNIFSENIQKLTTFIKETFAKHKDQLDVNDQRNLIDAFLVKQQEEKPKGLFFHDDNLTALVSNLFAAGTETTSTTLRWGILLMMKYPEIQKNVQNEIDNVIGSSQPQTEHRKDMPYTDAVIHEIQRFGNIAPNNLPHATNCDVTFRGYFIPKGTEVLPILASVLQDKAYFERPEEFYPQHFLDLKGNFVKNEAFLPFSAGRRSCAGENLAKMELFLFFTRLMQKFTFQSPPGVEIDLTPVFGITLSPSVHEICALPRN
ncbi:cytochrome P450 2K1-like isoform X3 [Pelobates fuscus]|uniref:cytochrome P450 2K1-like isoform X3 n=1 Tax=Pelobates fuscus TaxID=191477 RepID=UPI002FE4845B